MGDCDPDDDPDAIRPIRVRGNKNARSTWADGRGRTSYMSPDGLSCLSKHTQRIWRLRMGAALLEIVADPARLDVLERLSRSVEPLEDLAMLGLSDAVALLIEAHLVEGETYLGLTKLGRDVWLGIRSLIQ